MDFSPSVYEHAARFIGKSPWEVSRNKDLIVDAHFQAFQTYEHTPVTVGIDIYNLEAEAYGARVSKPADNNIPTIDVPIVEDLDQMIALPLWDLQQAGRIPMIIDAAREIKNRLPRADVRVPLGGPFSIASSLMGMEALLLAVTFQPETAQAALAHLADGQIRFCRYVKDAGLDITFFESAATPPLLSPRQFHSILLPVLKDMIVRIADLMHHDVALIIGGNTTPILEDIIETQSKYIICPSETDQHAFMEKIKAYPDILVRINMNPRIVSFGSHDDIVREIERIITLADKREKVCLGTGVLAYDTNPENIDLIKSVLAEK